MPCMPGKFTGYLNTASMYRWGINWYKYTVLRGNVEIMNRKMIFIHKPGFV